MTKRLLALTLLAAVGGAVLVASRRREGVGAIPQNGSSRHRSAQLRRELERL